MGLLDRPYAGTWRLNPNKVVRHTPDCLVYLNGQLTVPGCPTCGGRVDVQQFITSVSVEPSIQPIANASITMVIPRSSKHSLIQDGNFVIYPGFEVQIYMRGYFPVQGLLENNGETPDIDMSQAVVYPYYQVFHGLVTSVSFDYSGGEHTASITCSDMLHFWQYTQQASKGSLFGNFEGSGVRANLNNHTFAGMTPYSIMYTLYRDVQGVSGGVGFALSNKTNVSAVSGTGQGMWSMVGLYWEKRFSQHLNNLRMFGIDGTLYSAHQQAFLGRLSTKDSKRLSNVFADPNLKGKELDFFRGLQATARAVGWDPSSVYGGAASEKNAKEGSLGMNTMEMQAFVSDISAMGQINLFESDYQTKMDIANNVCEITGFEFYQDVDGDFVFKPPFYNLDTSDNRVYVIEDIDIISISVTTGEPQATVVKATASGFQNLAGTSLDGEYGRRALYVDFRLVAQYGWREESFETAYATDTRAMYLACVNRLDTFNIGIRQTNIQIPLRPELRPGYPVYVRHLDSFFYIQSISHSFTFGGQCTSSLTCVGKRSKFIAPGEAPQDRNATVNDIQLSNPWLPPLPLEVVGGDEGIPRFQGFPNVVLGIDPELLNPDLFVVGLDIQDLADEKQLDAIIRMALGQGILEIDPEASGSEREIRLKGPFVLRKSDTETVPVTRAQLLEQAKTYSEAWSQLVKARAPTKKGAKHTRDDLERLSLAREKASEYAAELQQVIEALQGIQGHAIEGGEEIANYFSLLENSKARFAPGNSTTGYYRYYSSSHPDEEQQGMKGIVADIATADTTQAGGLIYLNEETTTTGFQNVNEKNYFVPDGVVVKAGIPLVRPGIKNTAVPTPTHQIGTVAIARHEKTVAVSLPRQTADRPLSFPEKALYEPLYSNFVSTGSSYAWGSTVAQRFQDLYEHFVSQVDIQASIPSFETALKGVRGGKLDPTSTVEDNYKDAKQGVEAISTVLAKAIAKPVSTVYTQYYRELNQLYGLPGNNRSLGNFGSSPEDKQEVYQNLTDQWSEQILAFAGEARIGVSGRSDNFVVYVPDTKTLADYTPVFPVSDAQGYTVIGSYRYGRGLTVEEGGSFKTLSETSPFEFGGDLDLIDDFITNLTQTGSPSKAVGNMAEYNPELASQIALWAAESLDGVEVLQPSNSDKDMIDIAFSNWVASTKESTQKLNVANAALALADLSLDSDSTVCSCRGAETDVLLLAFSEEGFLDVGQPDQVSSWVADQMGTQIQPWTASQQALRGQVLNAGHSTLAEAVENLTRGDNSEIAYSQTRQILIDAKQNLEDED